MKPIKVNGNPYICYICGKTFDDINLWEKCEQSHQLRLIEEQKRLPEPVRIITEDFRDAMQRDKSLNFNLFFQHKFDGEKQENIFKTGE